MDCIGTTVKAERSPVTPKAKAYAAAGLWGFWKMESAGSGSAPSTGYPGSILGRKPLETTTCPTACRGMSSVTAVSTRLDWRDVLWRQQWV